MIIKHFQDSRCNTNVVNPIPPVKINDRNLNNFIDRVVNKDR